MHGIFWEVPAYAAAAAAERRASSSEHEALRAQRAVRRLEDRVEKLTMICAAMWTLLKQHADLHDDHLVRIVQEIDLSDGRLDGRVRHDAQTCPACKRSVAPRHSQCIYCGHEVQRRGAFGDVM